MSPRAAATDDESAVPRNLRIPASLCKRIAERQGQSLEREVIALLRRHYEQDVEVAPEPAVIVALALASLADVGASESAVLTRKLASGN